MKKYTGAIQEVVIIPQAAGNIVTCTDWSCKEVEYPIPSDSECYDVYDCTDEYSGTRCVRYYADKGCSEYYGCRWPSPPACYYYCG